ncbi:MAG: DUF2520 domain-containing protein [Myxococcota bacterium]|nr:DUF2520 domain-containing protein [Myxococcota bacterium]
MCAKKASMAQRSERKDARRTKGAKPVVFVIGAGKVGTALVRSLRRAGVVARLRPARSRLPSAIRADLIVLAVRDRELGRLARDLAERGIVPKNAAVVHVSGAVGADVLEPLRGACAGVGQMHPMIAFASLRFAPALAGGNVRVEGDRRAVALGKRVARLLGMTPRNLPGLDTVAYHAAAGLVANGAAALAALGAQLLHSAGVENEVTSELLGPLLRSVADNVAALGFPAALTGPVRRGDVRALEGHVEVLRNKLPQVVRFYLAAAEAQLPLARAVGEARSADLDEMARVIARETSRLH